MGSVEVWNSKDSRWEDLPFIKEDGSWKLAVGELFAGTFKIEAVGRGRDFREKEAANAQDPNHGLIQGGPPGSNMGTTANANIKPIKPKPEANAK